VKARRERLVLTPEHVPIRLEPAGLGSRFLALLMDVALVMVGVASAQTLFGLVLSQGMAQAATATVSLALLTGYPIWFEVRGQGRTPGKRAVGLRVVDGRGLPITLEQSFVRNVVRILDFAPLFYGVGGTVSLLDRDHRRLGDIVADTLVVRERRPLRPEARLRLERRFNALREPALARKARQRVSLEERELLLTLCLRADRLEERARYDLMERVGSHFRRKLAIDDPQLSNENLVRDLTALLYESPAGRVAR
jgi:uncharacterized RDD family membrane protein YckC